jgi:hypothetical protein
VKLLRVPAAYWSAQADATARDQWPRLFEHGPAGLYSLGERAGVDGGALSPSWRNYRRS